MISAPLKEKAVQILAGDLLNLGPMHKQDVEQILFYCICIMNKQLEQLTKQIVLLEADFTEKLEALEKSSQPYQQLGKKRR